MASQFQNKLKQAQNYLIKDLKRAKVLIADLEKEQLDSIHHIKLQILKAKMLLLEGKPKKAQEIFEPIEEKAKDINDEALHAEINLEYAANAMYLGKYPIAKKKIAAAIQYYQNVQNTEQLASCYIILGNLLYSQANHDQALEYYQKGLSIIKKSENNIYLKALGNIGNIYNAQGNLVQAVKFSKEALHLANKLENRRIESIISFNLGVTLYLQGNFKESLECFQKGEKIAQKMNYQMLIVLIRIETSKYWMELGEIKRATDILTQLEKTIQNLSHPHLKLEFYLASIKLTILQGDLNKAYQYAKTSVDYLNKSGRNLSQIDIYSEYAEIAFALGYEEEAYEHIAMANKIVYENKSESNIAKVLMTRGKINLISHNLYEAEIQLEEALWRAKKSKSFELEYKTLLLLVRVYLQKVNLAPSQKLTSKIEEILLESLAMAEKYKLVPCRVHSLILLGIFQISQHIYDLAKQNLSLALDLATAKGMAHDVQRISEILHLTALSPTDQQIKISSGFETELTSEDISFDILSQMPRFSSPNNQISLQNFAQALFKNFLDKITLSINQDSLQKQDFDNIFLVGYKIDEKIGPFIHSCSKPIENDPNWENVLQNISSIFYLAIGQGSAYHQGLYGPFPVMEKRMRALVYACFFKDPDMHDPRLNHQNYYLISLIFPQKMSPLFYNQQQLTSIFDEFHGKIEDINQITQSKFQQLKKHILDISVPKELISEA